MRLGRLVSAHRIYFRLSLLFNARQNYITLQYFMSMPEKKRVKFGNTKAQQRQRQPANNKAGCMGLIHQHSRVTSLGFLVSSFFAFLLFICPIAIAYSMGQIIKSVCFRCVCLSVRLRALSRSHFLIDFHQNWHRRKNPEK